MGENVLERTNCEGLYMVWLPLFDGMKYHIKRGGCNFLFKIHPLTYGKLSLGMKHFKVTWTYDLKMISKW